MMYTPLWQETTYQIYPINYTAATSSRVEPIDTEEIFKGLLTILMRKKSFKEFSFLRALLPLFEIDLSSVSPRLEIKSETFLKGKTIAAFPEEALEFDIVVKIPPKKRWKIRARIKSIKKATPHVVEPEEI